MRLRPLILVLALATFGCRSAPWCLDHVETFSAGHFKRGGRVTAGVSLHWHQAECPAVVPVRDEP